MFSYSDYKEIINMFIPFKIKGQWNKEACQTTLTDIGFDIVDSYEDIGRIRFTSLSAVLAFMKSISPERVERYEQFINFYADVLKKIKKNHFYEITTHKFMVIAKKSTNEQIIVRLSTFIFVYIRLKNIEFIE